MLSTHKMQALISQAAVFQQTQPYAYQAINDFLPKELFDSLCHTFPEQSLFEVHQDIARPNGQAPHNRRYLAYQESIYHDSILDTGVVSDEQLSQPWQEFLQALQANEYVEFITSMYGQKPSALRFAWHLSATGNEVSPHTDSRKKLGTHIFYFHHTDGLEQNIDWQSHYGGQTWILGQPPSQRKQRNRIDAFGTSIAIEIATNRSLIFKRSKHSWHAVAPLTCPIGVMRRTFHVIAMA